MSDDAIVVENLSKRYRIGKLLDESKSRGFLRNRLTSSFGYLASSLRQPAEDEVIFALKNVSFHVHRGEVIGIVGRNGAGKSTLLKILSRITEPTSGRALVYGRVGSLLEVGTGFHPELTGRENIYMNGAILGMKRGEIDQKFGEIVAFAETEKFLDTPVKRYSSGMYVRLAFAVAAHLEPEILVVDEVLAVGDQAFQKKCLGKMGDVATQGRTVLFVSHNLVAVQNLCGRVIWLQNGEIQEEGPTSSVISNYLATSYLALKEQMWVDITAAPGNDKVRLHRVCVRPAHGSPSDQITMSSGFVVEVEYWNLISNARLHVTLHFLTEQQIVAFTTGSLETDPITRDELLSTGLYRSVCEVPGDFLNSGVHRVMLLIVENTDTVIFRLEDALSFDMIEVESRAGTWYGKEPGVIRPKLKWETERIGA
jgi:lipopolysaccharide transport system ATP-binding protein